MVGIINIYKEKGMTSFDVIAKLRKILKEKKIGHTGTLDPNATGVLAVCIGNATKLVPYIINNNKEYIATLKLGILTDTQDITGKVIKEEQVPNITLKEIKEVCSQFVGKQMQIPPMYSATKKNGKKLYQLARLGIEIVREPKSIEIFDVSDVKYNKKENIITFKVSCSKGTFIRTLCVDIAEKLNTIGTLLDLERISIGNFSKKDSLTLNEIEELYKKDNIEKIVYNLEDLFSNYEKINLKQEDCSKLLNGVKLVTEEKNDGIYRIYQGDKFIGLGSVISNQLKREYIILD